MSLGIEEMPYQNGGERFLQWSHLGSAQDNTINTNIRSGTVFRLC